jgi:dihydroneopterin aldolase
MSYPDIYLVSLRRIEAAASIGIHAFEQAAKQKLYVSVTLILPRPMASGDDIRAVQDYDFVREGLLKLAAAQHFNLQETLCGEILDLCMAQAGVLGAVVQTDKPDVYPAVAGVACRMARLRPSLSGFPWWTVNV